MSPVYDLDRAWLFYAVKDSKHGRISCAGSCRDILHCHHDVKGSRHVPEVIWLWLHIAGLGGCSVYKVMAGSALVAIRWST